jgi:ribose transport system substrate-binding protein
VRNTKVKRLLAGALGVGVVAGLGLGIAPAAHADHDAITFIQGVKGDGFYITMECGVKAAAKKAGYKVQTVGPEKFDATLQKPILDAVIASKPDAILIAPNDVKAMQKPLEKAKKAGIKVVLVDTTVNSPGKVAVSEISSNNYAGGAAALKAVKQAGVTGGKVLGIGVQPGISTTDARDKGFQDAVAKDGNFEFIGQEYSKNEPAIAAQITTAAIAANPDLKAIFASNLFSAQGAATGIKQAGKEGEIVVIGFDAGPDQIKALKDGTVQALIAQKPYTIGAQGVDQAVKAIDGKSTTKKITTGFTIITPKNVNTNFGKKAAYSSTC